MLLVDVDANPAKAVWLGDLEQRPALLSDPWLLYLGQSDKSIVFVACGQTLVLPADQVSAVVLTRRLRRPIRAARPRVGQPSASDRRTDKRLGAEHASVSYATDSIRVIRKNVGPARALFQRLARASSEEVSFRRFNYSTGLKPNGYVRLADLPVRDVSPAPTLPTNPHPPV